MSWKYRILIAFLLGVSGMMYLVVRSMQITTEMVEGNYYEKELDFENQMAAVENFRRVQNNLNLVISRSAVELDLDTSLSKNILNGSANFYYAANSKSDRIFTMYKSMNGKYSFDKSALTKGKNTLKISFQAKGKPYYKEEVIFIP